MAKQQYAWGLVLTWGLCMGSLSHVNMGSCFADSTLIGYFKLEQTSEHQKGYYTGYYTDRSFVINTEMEFI